MTERFIIIALTIGSFILMELSGLPLVAVHGLSMILPLPCAGILGRIAIILRIVLPVRACLTPVGLPLPLAWFYVVPLHNFHVWNLNED
jgi:hypothetical protein